MKTKHIITQFSFPFMSPVCRFEDFYGITQHIDSVVYGKGWKWIYQYSNQFIMVKTICFHHG